MWEGRSFYGFNGFTIVTQPVTRMKETIKEIESAFPGTTGRGEKRPLLVFWSQGKSGNYKCPL